MRADDCRPTLEITCCGERNPGGYLVSVRPSSSAERPENQNNVASFALLQRAEWALSYSIGDLRSLALVAAEAYAIAAVVLQPANARALGLVKDLADMRRPSGQIAPSLHASLTELNARIATFFNVDRTREANEAEGEANRRFLDGHHAAALPLIQRVVFVRTEILGEDAVPTLNARFLEARILNFLGRQTEALMVAQDVVGKQEQHPDLGPVHPVTLSTQLFMVPILSSFGRSEEALCIAQNVTDKREKHPRIGPLHPSTLASRFLVAQILDKLGDSNQALPIAQDVATKAEHHPSLGPRHHSTIAGWFLVAEILDKVGHRAEALPIAQEVVKRGERNPSLGPLHPSTLVSLRLVARILQTLGRDEEANVLRRDIDRRRRK